MNVPYRIAQAFLPLLTRIGLKRAKIVVNRAGNNVEIKSLRRRRLLEHKRSETFRASVGEPLFNGQAVAFSF